MQPSKLPSEKSGNAFDALRMLAAMAVLYSHSFALYGLPEPLLLAGQSFGSLAVALFFSVSGFLICQSWERDPHFGRYAARRALRIFPGLWFVVLITALLIGAIFTTVSLADYFGSASPWRYIVTGSLALGSPKLIGVFEDNPFPLSTNGSLWTLKYEIIMYVLLAVLGRLSAGSRMKLKCGLALLVFASMWLVFVTSGQKNVPVPFVWRLGAEIYLDRIGYLGAFFFAGACAYLYFDRIYLSRLVATIVPIGLYFVDNSVLVMVTLWAAVPYIALVFAFKAPLVFRKVNGHDYSYGIYIYAFPLQQIISQIGTQYQWSWAQVLALSTVATASAAALSWHYVEKPALRLKKYIPLMGRRSEASIPETVQRGL